jgi:hypothetical protein
MPTRSTDYPSLLARRSRSPTVTPLTSLLLIPGPKGVNWTATYRGVVIVRVSGHFAIWRLCMGTMLRFGLATTHRGGAVAATPLDGSR